ncbi:hypothetical protein AYO21_02693 [Fonsecaea monophora]|uniref:Uncharacterized protein n=1 Tax=Fonsecaea monophora TaxID=254056 RepID=A0A177FFJ8_9EURO|nr:hypothetical protein AYO21_02693 [Fonsecaea monophora]KAH0836052.1 hypothetical protein FOPE_04339 [Fonsecaea pedrosoi]OAG43074.1 hypothetical protein AYO21_02693 [Fonsecaea monophora]
MLFLSLIFLSQFLSLLAAPMPLAGPAVLVQAKRAAVSNLRLPDALPAPPAIKRRHLDERRSRAMTAVSSTRAPSAATATSCPAPGTAPVNAAAGGETAEKININGTFGQAVALQGGDIQTDVLYPPSAIGSLEIEFKNRDGRTLNVRENKTPAPPPTGFVALEPSSFIVNLAGGTQGLTLQKVDYIFNVANPAVVAANIAQAQVGKLSADGCQFVIDTALGELEFEAEENELSLTVADMNGEWGIFVSQAAVASQAAAEETPGEEVNVNGTFETAIAVPGGNVKTDILFPESTRLTVFLTPQAAGALEVEYNGTNANAITVTQNANPASPPAGFLFVDRTTFQVATDTATNPATDIVKVDYIYSEQVKRLVDVNQGVIGKLDPATNTFITSGLGEFEVELDENEWTLTVEDLNGEWAILIPQAALLG